MITTACLNGAARPKKRYPSEHAAHRDLARSPRWRRRATWPTVYLCRCGYFHLGHPEVDK